MNTERRQHAFTLEAPFMPQGDPSTKRFAAYAGRDVVNDFVYE